MRNATIVSWNIWSGCQFAELSQALQVLRSDVDIFCLQEVYSCPSSPDAILPRNSKADLMEILQRNLLPEFEGDFCPFMSNIGNLDARVTCNLSFGTAIFVRRSLPVVGAGRVLIAGHPTQYAPSIGGTVPRYLAHVILDLGGGRLLSVANYHGLYHKNFADGSSNKVDSEARIRQSELLCTGLDQLPGSLVLCGDLNLRPDTQSFQLLVNGLRCPLLSQGITSTRSSIHYKKAEKYADYILHSDDLEVAQFDVIPAHEASDHLPIRLILNV
jgi:endonuclease/exonuclease/phosphatase family metal-dependent hydrolase